jgi:hypothetical protein
MTNGALSRREFLAGMALGAAVPLSAGLRIFRDVVNVGVPERCSVFSPPDTCCRI